VNSCFLVSRSLWRDLRIVQYVPGGDERVAHMTWRSPVVDLAHVMCSKYPQVIILMKNAVIELCDLNVWDAFGIVSEQDASDCKETTRRNEYFCTGVPLLSSFRVLCKESLQATTAFIQRGTLILRDVPQTEIESSLENWSLC